MNSAHDHIRRLRKFDPQPFLYARMVALVGVGLQHSIQALAVGLTAACLLLTGATQARAAHPISVTEARIFVTQKSARARIQLFAEDLLLFQGLEVDENGRLPPGELRRGLELHKAFLVERVTLRDAEGNLIPSRVTDLVPFEIPDEGIAEEDLMLYQATYELEYQFAAPPEFLTFQQDITDENFILPSEMKLAIHQTGSGNVIAGTLQPAGAVTHRFDWDALLDPNATDEEYESWLEKQRTDTLGITSYSSVYSFIYIEPGEVRHEVLIPLASLTSILPIEHADPAFLEVDEQEAVRTLIRDWLTGGNPTQINGQAVDVEFSRIDFHGLSLRDFAKQAKQRRVSFASGRAGIILRYLPEDGFVKDIDLQWDTFHSSIRKIRSVVMPWAGDIQRFEFSRFKKPEDNTFQWSADSDAVPTAAAAVSRTLPDRPTLRVPVVSCVLLVLAISVPLVVRKKWQTTLACLLLAAVCWPLAGTDVAHPLKPIPTIDADRSRLIAEQLHSGTYQALDFGSEQRIYDALEQFVDDELLESLYLQLREGLAIREQGGAVARVREVEYLDGQNMERDASGPEWPGYRFHSTWVVAGTVEHWGHIHERRNQFSAVLGVEPRDGTWKITSMQIDSQQSLSGTTSLRQF